MNEHLQVALIQSHLIWENPKANRLLFSEKIVALPQQVDLVVLPEMFSTGFTMNAEAVAETMNGETLSWMIQTAKKNEVAITGSLVIEENQKFYNRLFFVFPDGTFKTYDKRHSFTLAGEDKVYSSGKERLIVDYKGWKICPLICYDLRFPVFSRNTLAYDVLIYVANWPKKRILAWDILLKARAIENMSYVIGVNRVGLDGNGYEYTGHSSVFDTLGEKIDHLSQEKEDIDIITLQKSHIQTYREKLNFLNDRDDFNLVV